MQKSAIKECLFASFMILFGLVSSMAVVQAAEHKMVIQVNSKDKLTQKMALVNAGNLKSQLGNDNVDVEVVMYGPGLSLVKKDSLYAARITRLQQRGVVFSVCEGSIKAIEKKAGAEPQLLPDMQRVRTGALRILELQEKGWSYLRP